LISFFCSYGTFILWESLNTSPPIKREKLSAVGHRNGAKELK
jgi:hypothetical protein